jgi:ribosome-interacting GTPase 1
VEDLARQIHKDIAANLQYARIWGEGYYDGQRVPRDHPLRDMDVVELRA